MVVILSPVDETELQNSGYVSLPLAHLICSCSIFKQIEQ
jgi:hypothetical protein